MSLYHVCTEMEIQLHDHEKPSVEDSAELSCFSHLNDSHDIPVSFTLVHDSTNTLTVHCPAESNTSVGCVSPVQGRDWEVCRNESAPYNCYMVIHDFHNSDSGNYTCSTNVTGRVIISNELNLVALKNLKPAQEPRNQSKSSGSKWVLGLGVGVGALLFLLLVMVLAINVVRSYKKARNGKCVLC